MDIFESLENLNVSEECFNDIVDIVEEFVAEKLVDTLNLPQAKLKDLYAKYRKNLKGKVTPGRYGKIELKGRVPSVEDIDYLKKELGDNIESNDRYNFSMSTQGGVPQSPNFTPKNLTEINNFQPEDTPGRRMSKNPNKYISSSPIEDENGSLGRRELNDLAKKATNKSLKKKDLEGASSAGTPSSFKEWIQKHAK